MQDWMRNAAREIIDWETEQYGESYDPAHVDIFARIILRHWHTSIFQSEIMGTQTQANSIHALYQGCQMPEPNPPIDASDTSDAVSRAMQRP